MSKLENNKNPPLQVRKWYVADEKLLMYGSVSKVLTSLYVSNSTSKSVKTYEDSHVENICIVCNACLPYPFANLRHTYNCKCIKR